MGKAHRVLTYCLGAQETRYDALVKFICNNDVMKIYDLKYFKLNLFHIYFISN